MREYELYVVMDAATEESDVSALIEKLTQMISAGDGKTSGEVIKVDVRDKRRLTYPIKKKVEGQDIILNFQTPPHTLAELERILKLNEQVLRHLIVRLGEE
jgi:small subunit ribosomal protein S6